MNQLDVDIDYQPGDLVLLRSRRAGGLRLPAQGPYRFKFYRGRAKLTADIEDPLTGQVIPATTSHFYLIKGQHLNPLDHEKHR